jgi:5'-nucleotidase
MYLIFFSDLVGIYMAIHSFYFFSQVNGKFIIKSGTDFRHFSKIILNFDKASVDVNVEEISVTSAFPEDPVLKQLLEKYASKTE